MMKSASRRRRAALIAAMSLALCAAFLHARNASAQQSFQYGEWSDWGGICRSPIEHPGVPASRGQPLGAQFMHGYQFGASFIDENGNRIPEPEDESIRALAICYQDRDNGGESIEVQTDFSNGELYPTWCPEDHRFLGTEGSSIAVKCQIMGILSL